MNSSRPLSCRRSSHPPTRPGPRRSAHRCRRRPDRDRPAGHRSRGAGDATSAAEAAPVPPTPATSSRSSARRSTRPAWSLQRQQSAAHAADRAAVAAQTQLDAFDGQIRQLARSAYTSEGFTSLDVMLTSGSADEFVHQMGTLDAIAGHTNDLVTQVGLAADQAKAAQARQGMPRRRPRRPTTPSRPSRSSSRRRSRTSRRSTRPCGSAAAAGLPCARGTAVAAPAHVAAPSGAAQVAVNTALAQVGDPYVWGAAGPDAFDCSGLTSTPTRPPASSLPHSSASQSTMGTPVSRGPAAARRPGVLLQPGQPRGHVHRQRPDGPRRDVRHAGPGRQPGLAGQLQQRPPPHGRLSTAPHRLRAGGPLGGHRPSSSVGARFPRIGSTR